MTPAMKPKSAMSAADTWPEVVPLSTQGSLCTPHSRPLCTTSVRGRTDKHLLGFPGSAATGWNRTSVPCMSPPAVGGTRFLFMAPPTGKTNSVPSSARTLPVCRRPLYQSTFPVPQLADPDATAALSRSFGRFTSGMPSTSSCLADLVSMDGRGGRLALLVLELFPQPPMSTWAAGLAAPAAVLNIPISALAIAIKPTSTLTFFASTSVPLCTAWRGFRSAAAREAVLKSDELSSSIFDALPTSRS
mmetsp:Transcript_53376/g.127317  ORF Transcript_53376/g.127317 Transcript_53376/m.127317 type:complete len:246 (-) Transcript_53376:7-744(-)